MKKKKQKSVVREKQSLRNKNQNTSKFNELSKIIAGYVGCRILTLCDGKPTHTEFTFSTFWLFRTACVLWRTTPFSALAKSFPKLILRTPDDLTKAERDKVKKIYEVKYIKVDEKKRVYDSAREINYLRSIGVDCDGLIGLGIAISKKDYDSKIKKAGKSKKG